MLGGNEMSITINLSGHSDKFAVGSHELVIDKKVNFVFGKNGTGKTTIADEIKEQFPNSHDVHVFKDFDGVAENARLDAVALGTENAAIQLEIDAIDKEIVGIKEQIQSSEEGDNNSLFARAVQAKKDFAKQEKEIKSFYTFAAGQIKNINNPQIAETAYNTRNFQSEISKACTLSDDDIETYKKLMKADEKTEVDKIAFPTIDLMASLAATNEILQLSVEQRQNIPELGDSDDKRNFAQQGAKIHRRDFGEKCAFCGNEIDNTRWLLLDSYFNVDEVEKLESSISEEISKLNLELGMINSIKGLKESSFYDNFLADVKSLNSQIKVRQSESRDFLLHLKDCLETKRNNLFVKSPSVQVVIPKDFADIKPMCDELVDSHNKLSGNFGPEQDKAKDALRYHEIYKRLSDFKHDEKTGVLNTLKIVSEDAQKVLEDKKVELERKQEERLNLISQTKDEGRIAKDINRLLTSMGVTSFSLKLVEDDDENQRGQYQIRGHDDRIRPITHLSKGEKNIIAFLYFVFSLESVDRNNRPRILVLDDPMTSNDDTMQYLMIGEIQKLYRNLENGSYIIILTHNCHFYLNVRPNMNIKGYYNKHGDYHEGSYGKYGIYHLFSSGNCATIKRVTSGKEDFRTSYETLWKELVFLYNAQDATCDLMLNPCRKICETYMKFTKKSIEKFYQSNINAKKLFDVNLHSIDDLDAELNGRTREELKTILSELFKQNDAEEHFNDHWKGGER